MAAALDSLSEDNFDALFGLRVDLKTQKERLMVATMFLRIRQHLEANAGTLNTYTLVAYHKSTKKQLIHDTLMNISLHKVEEKIIIGSTVGCSNEKALKMVILLAFSLQRADFKEIEEHGVVNPFLRLVRHLPIGFSLNEKLKRALQFKIADTLGCHTFGDESYGFGRPQNALTLAQPSKGLRYQVAEVNGIDFVLKHGMFDFAVKSGTGWVGERLRDDESSHLSNSLWADVPNNLGQDIVFHIVTSWEDGWRLIDVLGFKKVSVLN